MKMNELVEHCTSVEEVTSGFDSHTSQCFQNKTSAVASDGNFYICDAYFHSGKFPK